MGRPAPTEPFGTLAMRGADGGLWAKWRAVAKDIAAETQAIARCRIDRAGCPSAAALQFLAIIAAANSRQGRARLGEINRAINLAIRPMSDLAQYGVPDYWSAPLATLAAGAGDCEDYAIAKYVALREAGLAEDDLRLVIVHDVKLQEDHAVTAVRLEGRWLILDNRRLVMLEDAELTQYVPLYAIDAAGLKRLVTPQTLQALAGSATSPTRATTAPPPRITAAPRRGLPACHADKLKLRAKTRHTVASRDHLVGSATVLVWIGQPVHRYPDYLFLLDGASGTCHHNASCFAPW